MNPTSSPEPGTSLAAWRFVRRQRVRRAAEAAARQAKVDLVAARRSISPDNMGKVSCWADLSSSL